MNKNKIKIFALWLTAFGIIVFCLFMNREQEGFKSNFIEPSERLDDNDYVPWENEEMNNE